MFRLHQVSSKECIGCFNDKRFGVLEILFFEDPLCIQCRQILKPKLRKTKVLGITVMSLYLYRDDVRTMMIRYKESFDELLHCVFIHPLKMRLQLLYSDYVFVCLPTTKHSIERRGFDHLRLMIEVAGLKILDDVLHKMPSPKQSMQSVKARSEVSQYFHVLDCEVIAGKKVILVDDVCTTGASLKACYELLKPYCKVIKVLALCIHPLLLEP